MANSMTRKYKAEVEPELYPTISIGELADHRARMLLSKDAFKLYRAMRCGLLSETSMEVDMIVYDVTPKEWVEALTMAMEAGHA